MASVTYALPARRRLEAAQSRATASDREAQGGGAGRGFGTMIAAALEMGAVCKKKRILSSGKHVAIRSRPKVHGSRSNSGVLSASLFR